MNFNIFENFFNRYWKPLTFVMLIVLLASVSILFYNQMAHGSVLKRDVELTGGKEISIEQFSFTAGLNKITEAIPDAEVRVIGNTLIVSLDSTANESQIQQKLQDLGVQGKYSTKFIGPSFSETQWRIAQIAIITAFILMSIVIFVLFRTFVPSIAVILCGATDILVSMAILSIMDVRLSLPVLAALLMLIGYSVDTDVVLTTELLRTKGRDVPGRIKTAMKTGITMTMCALAALTAMYFVSQDPVLQQIATVLIIGLLIDMPATWLTNAGILRWYANRKERKEAG